MTDFLQDGLVLAHCSPRDSQESSPTPQFESISSLTLSFLYKSTLLHPYMTTGKTIALTRQTFVDKTMSLLFNMLSRLVITFLPRSKHLLISWLQSSSADKHKVGAKVLSTESFMWKYYSALTVFLLLIT